MKGLKFGPARPIARAHPETAQPAPAMISTSAIALSGMTAAQGSLQVAAHNIANQGTPGFRRQQAVLSADASGGVQASLATAKAPGDSLESDVVGLLQAKNAFLANLAVFRAGDRMMGALLDIRA